MISAPSIVGALAAIVGALLHYCCCSLCSCYSSALIGAPPIVSPPVIAAALALA